MTKYSYNQLYIQLFFSLYIHHHVFTINRRHISLSNISCYHNHCYIYHLLYWYSPSHRVFATNIPSVLLRIIELSQYLVICTSLCFFLSFIHLSLISQYVIDGAVTEYLSLSGRCLILLSIRLYYTLSLSRSEERRVGKEC